MSLLTAVLLKVVLEVVVWAKDHVKGRFKAATTTPGKVGAGLLLWGLMIGSKFVVLELVALLFADQVKLGGFWSVTGLLLLLLVARAGVRRLLGAPDPRRSRSEVLQLLAVGLAGRLDLFLALGGHLGRVFEVGDGQVEKLPRLAGHLTRVTQFLQTRQRHLAGHRTRGRDGVQGGAADGVKVGGRYCRLAAAGQGECAGGDRGCQAAGGGRRKHGASVEARSRAGPHSIVTLTRPRERWGEMPTTPGRRTARVPGLDELRLLTKVARLYHEKGVRQPQIAETLKLSQARVSRMLKQAESLGIVTTVITMPPGVHGDLEDQLQAHYGLRDVVVVDAEPAEVRAALGAATAAYLGITLTRGHVVGITSWSESVLAAGDAACAGGRATLQAHRRSIERGRAALRV